MYQHILNQLVFPYKFRSPRLVEAMEPKGESERDVHFKATRKRKGNIRLTIS